MPSRLSTTQEQHAADAEAHAGAHRAHAATVFDVAALAAAAMSMLERSLVRTRKQGRTDYVKRSPRRETVTAGKPPVYGGREGLPAYGLRGSLEPDSTQTP